MTLDIIGKVDRFGEVFDIEYFKKHRAEAYFKILKTLDGDAKDDNAVFAKDLYKLAMEKGIIPDKSKELYRDYQKKQHGVGIKRRIMDFLHCDSLQN